MSSDPLTQGCTKTLRPGLSNRASFGAEGQPFRNHQSPDVPPGNLSSQEMTCNIRNAHCGAVSLVVRIAGIDAEPIDRGIGKPHDIHDDSYCANRVDFSDVRRADLSDRCDIAVDDTVASTRNERRRRWFLRTLIVSEWLSQWRASVWAANAAAPLSRGSGGPPSAQLWAKFAADSRVPSGVILQVRQRGTGVTISLPLTDPYLLIGNHPRCQLRLDGGTGRETQYALFWLHGELYGVDLRRNSPHPPSDERVDGWWTDGQTLRIGEYQLQVQGLPGIPSRMIPVEDDSTVTLHLESPRGRQERHLTRWLTLIGCAADSGVIVREGTIAARQAALIRTPTSLWIVNLADGLSPRIANRPVDWTALDPMDEFTFGETKAHVATTWPERMVAASATIEFPNTDTLNRDGVAVGDGVRATISSP